MTVQEPFYTISELADLAGVSPRTIRYYTGEGLLPPPDTRGRYALYSADHLRRLQLIARLKDAYLPLNAIKERIEQLPTDQIEQLLADHTPSLRQAAPSSAVDYIAQVLGNESRDIPYPREPKTAPPAGILHGGEAKAPLPVGEGFGEGSKVRTYKGETWRRVRLAPGVELHIEEQAGRVLHERIDRLITFAQEMFEGKSVL